MLTDFIPVPLTTPKSIRQSSVGIAATCDFKYLLEERFRLTKAEHKSEPFVGQVFHLAHSLRWQNYPGSIKEIVDRAVNDYREVIADSLKKRMPFDEAKAADEQIEKDAALGLAMSDVHWERHPKPENYKVLLMEKDLDGTAYGLPISGRIDLVVGREIRGQEYVSIIDFKTTKDPSAMRAKVRHSTQTYLYRHLVEQALGKKVCSFNYLICQRPSIQWKNRITKTRKTPQTYEDYLVEVREWLTGTGRHEDRKSEIEANDPMPIEPVIFESDSDPEDMYVRWERTNLLRQLSPDLDKYPRTGRDNGACRYCPHKILCDNPTENWAKTIERFYTVRDLNGLASDFEELL